MSIKISYRHGGERYDVGSCQRSKGLCCGGGARWDNITDFNVNALHFNPLELCNVPRWVERLRCGVWDTISIDIDLCRVLQYKLLWGSHRCFGWTGHIILSISGISGTLIDTDIYIQHGLRLASSSCDSFVPFCVLSLSVTQALKTTSRRRLNVVSQWSVKIKKKTIRFNLIYSFSGMYSFKCGWKIRIIWRMLFQWLGSNR